MATIASLLRSLDRSVLAAASVWRQQLLATTEVVLNSTAVSRALAETMAARQAYLVDQSAAILAHWATTDRTMTAAVDRIDLAAFTREVAAGPLRELNAALSEALRPIARISAVNWAEQFRGWAAEGGQLDRELCRHAGSVECSAKGLTEPDLLTAAREGDALIDDRESGW